jgi:uncharacterized protein (DUF1697 family)
MPTYIALLRAVNVGGRFIKMERARKALEDNAFVDVESHIQSGNILLTTPMRSVPKVEAAVSGALSEAAGFDVVAIVRTPEELTALVKAVDGIPKGLPGDARRYVAFCKDRLDAGGARALDAWDVPGERAYVVGKDVVLELDVLSHQAKLTNARAQRLAGHPMTSRDMKVVRTLAEKWGSNG